MITYRYLLDSTATWATMMAVSFMVSHHKRMSTRSHWKRHENKLDASVTGEKIMFITNTKYITFPSLLMLWPYFDCRAFRGSHDGLF